MAKLLMIVPSWWRHDTSARRRLPTAGCSGSSTPSTLTRTVAGGRTNTIFVVYSRRFKPIGNRPGCRRAGVVCGIDVHRHVEAEIHNNR